MDRRYGFSAASVLYFISVAAFTVALLSVRGHWVKLVSIVAAVLFGYIATLVLCKSSSESQRIMLNFLKALFLGYIIILVDYTLIDEAFGRNIFNVLGWYKGAFSNYIKQSINIVPLQTVKLFINAFLNKNLSFLAVAANLLGNLAVLAPLPFFCRLFFKRLKSGINVFVLCLVSSVAIELLQLLFLTGSCDIDDVILNVAGALLFYFVLKIKKISNLFSRLTFGTWKSEA